MELNERFLLAKEVVGMSSRQIAQKAGVHPNTVYNLQSSRYCFTTDTILFIAKAMGISPSWLAFGEGEMFGGSAQVVWKKKSEIIEAVVKCLEELK